MTNRRKSRTPAERDVQRPEDLRIHDNPFLGASDVQDLRDALRAAKATLDQMHETAKEHLKVARDQLAATERLHVALVARLGNGHDLEPLPSTT